jgi:hypothetical protein
MKRIGWVLASASLFLSLPSFGQFAQSVIAYEPGTGFAPGFTNATTALGAPSSGSSITPFSPPFQKTQIVSVGAGGWLTVQLGTPILGDPSHSFGIDFIIFGNSGFVITNGNFSGGGITDGSLLGNNTGSTRVEVSLDGSAWFTLNPALAPTVDGLFPTDGTGDPQRAVDPALADASFAGLGLGDIRSLYGGSAGGTGFSLGWAQDDSGNSVNLASADFVRIDVLSGKSEIDAISVVPEPPPGCLALLGAALFLFQPKRTYRTQSAAK